MARHCRLSSLWLPLWLPLPPHLLVYSGHLLLLHRLSCLQKLKNHSRFGVSDYALPAGLPCVTTPSSHAEAHMTYPNTGIPFRRPGLRITSPLSELFNRALYLLSRPPLLSTAYMGIKKISQNMDDTYLMGPATGEPTVSFHPKSSSGTGFSICCHLCSILPAFLVCWPCFLLITRLEAFRDDLGV